MKKTANVLKHIQSGFTYDAKKISYFEGASQSMIPIRNIQDGMIITNDNRYISMIEVLPCAFHQKTSQKRASITKSFQEVFQNKHVKWHLYIMRETEECLDLIENVKNNCRNQSDETIKKNLNNYIKYLKQLAAKGSVSERFFFFWEYSGIDGEKSHNPDEIAQTMWENKQAIVSSLENAGNICIAPDEEDKANVLISTFLYKFFNRNTSKTESIYERYARLTEDYRKFEFLTGIKKEVTYADLLAPKGLDFRSRDYILQDGSYYGYISFASDSWVSGEVPDDWLKRFKYGPNTDISVIGKLLPHELTITALKAYNSNNRISTKALYRKGKNDRAEKKYHKYMNINDVLNHMENGADLYDEAIVLTIRATSAQELRTQMRLICHDLKHQLHIEPDTSYLCCEDYYVLTMPFLYFTPVFKRIKHNVLSSKMGCFYPFTTTTINDPNGWVLGYTEDKYILSIDNFNTDYYENANVILVGTSGAGKTYAEQLIANRAYLNGKRCFFIIPKKGYQYKNGADLVNGLYAQFMPGSKQRINIMEIRPEIAIDTSVLNENTIISNESLLAQKINQLLTWLELSSEDVKITSQMRNKLSGILHNLYASFGITDDNDSIFDDKSSGILKEMPIISDWYNALPDDDIYTPIKEILEPWVSGQCKNMNGPTNIDLDNPYIVFDCNEDIIGKQFLPSFLYIAFITIMEIIKSSPCKDILFFDEVWKIMRNAKCAEQIFEAVKLIRGYGGSTFIVTQEVKDFLRCAEGYGESIIDNSSLYIFLKMKDNEIKHARSIYNNLTDTDLENITKFKRGDCLVISNGDKIRAKIIPSVLEDKYFADKTSRQKSA